jgi:hypothetical protein
MAIPDKYKDLVKRLTNATQEGRVSWREPFNNPEVFEVDMSAGRLRVRAIVTDVDDKAIELAVMGPLDKALHAFQVDETDKEFQTMRALYDSAMFNARGVDKLLKRLSDELGDK